MHVMERLCEDDPIRACQWTQAPLGPATVISRLR